MAALGSALLWSLSSLLFGHQSGRVPAVTLSAVRLAVAALVLWLVLGVLLLGGEVEGLSVRQVLGLVGSAALGIGLGDTIYIAGIGMAGVARAYPISTAVYPLFTFVLAALLLGEAITLPLLGGSLLIVVGLTLIVSRERADEQARPPGVYRRGVLYVLIGALTWAIVSVWLRSAAEGVNAVTAGALRLPAAWVAVALLAQARREPLWPWRFGRRSTLLMTINGVLGTALGSLLFLVAVQEAGAGRAAILSSTGPLWGLPLAALILHERVTWRVALGTLVSVAGIVLVTG